MSEEEYKKLFRERKFEEIENDEIINYSKDSQESELQKDSNIHKFEVRKRTLKSRPDDDILIKQNRRSTLTDLQLENDMRVIFLQMKLLINLLNSLLSLMKL